MVGYFGTLLGGDNHSYGKKNLIGNLLALIEEVNLGMEEDRGV